MKLQLVSYGFKCASHSFSDRPFVHTYIQLENYRSHMDTLHVNVLHIEWLLYCERYCLCDLNLHERLDWRATGPDTPVIFWYNIVCKYCKPAHTSLFGTQLHMTTKLMLLMSSYYVPKTALLPMMYCFYNNKVIAALLVAMYWPQVKMRETLVIWIWYNPQLPNNYQITPSPNSPNVQFKLPFEALLPSKCSLIQKKELSLFPTWCFHIWFSHIQFVITEIRNI